MTTTKPSGYQNWRDLLFVHWIVDAAALRELVPRELELDLWEGNAYVGVVPFAMEGVRPALLPRVFAMDFLETNTRTYVKRGDEAGVYFFSLEASSYLAVKAARIGWGLPYFHAEMSLVKGDDGVIDYASTRKTEDGTCNARCMPGRLLGASQPGTLEYFLLERYLLFTVKNERVSRGVVKHVPYPAQEVELLSIETDLVSAAGLARPTSAPACAHFAAGVDVEVFGPYPIDR